jgi:hypothetical protein
LPQPLHHLVGRHVCHTASIRHAQGMRRLRTSHEKNQSPS